MNNTQINTVQVKCELWTTHKQTQFQ